MEPENVLILEDDDLTAHHVSEIFDAVSIRHVTYGAADAAWRHLCACPDIDLLVVRAGSAHIDGVEFCRRVRLHQAAEELPILVLFSEEQRDRAGQALAAGATDFIRVPFDSRRFRAKAGIADETLRRRVDPAPGESSEQISPHSFHGDAASTDFPQNAEVPAAAASHQHSGSHAVRLVVPVFDPASCAMKLPASAEQVRAWEANPAVRRVELDVVMSCPSCGGLPTFRSGCPCCGSAINNAERLIHHYACAHIAPERAFRTGDHLTCPKCLRTHLVAGSDFEVMSGVTACRECEALITQPATICQCLRCQYRFPADEAVLQPVMGYEVPLPVHQQEPASGSRNAGPATRRTATAPV